jgi:hypothetical protein
MFLAFSKRTPLYRTPSSLSPNEHRYTEHVPRFLQTNTAIQNTFLVFSKRTPRYGTCFSVYPPMKTNCTCISIRDPAIANKGVIKSAGRVIFSGKAENSACRVGGFCSQISPDRSVRRQASDVMGFCRKFKQKLKNQAKNTLQ